MKKKQTNANAKQQQQQQQKHAILKLESHKLIPYIADLTDPFIFSEVNKKRKSRHQC